MNFFFRTSDGEIKATEDRYRSLFASSPNSRELEDPHLGLINVFENRDSFTFSPSPPSSPEILASKKQLDSGPSVVSREIFLDNWKRFTINYRLDQLDWSNTFVAGGSVLGEYCQLNLENQAEINGHVEHNRLFTERASRYGTL